MTGMHSADETKLMKLLSGSNSVGAFFNVCKRLNLSVMNRRDVWAMQAKDADNPASRRIQEIGSPLALVALKYLFITIMLAGLALAVVGIIVFLDHAEETNQLMDPLGWQSGIVLIFIGFAAMIGAFYAGATICEENASRWHTITDRHVRWNEVLRSLPSVHTVYDALNESVPGASFRLTYAHSDAMCGPLLWVSVPGDFRELCVYDGKGISHMQNAAAHILGRKTEQSKYSGA